MLTNCLTSSLSNLEKIATVSGDGAMAFGNGLSALSILDESSLPVSHRLMI